VRFATRLAVAGLFAIGVALGPAIAASASSSVTVQWVSDIGTYSQTYSCSGTATHEADGLTWYVDYVSNGCGDRVWLHANTDGSGASYCINPGAVAYGAIGSYRQAQFSGTATSACDAGTDTQVTWSDYASTPYSCVDGFTATDYNVNTWEGILEIINRCNTRIWVHEGPDGKGDAWCVDPAAGGNPNDPTVWSEPGAGDTPDTQFQITANQAPCAAGNP
jgi:hypothetical protein